jgi:hypothetical protein
MAHGLTVAQSTPLANAQPLAGPSTGLSPDPTVSLTAPAPTAPNMMPVNGQDGAQPNAQSGALTGTSIAMQPSSQAGLPAATPIRLPFGPAIRATPGPKPGTVTRALPKPGVPSMLPAAVGPSLARNPTITPPAPPPHVNGPPQAGINAPGPAQTNAPTLAEMHPAAPTQNNAPPPIRISTPPTPIKALTPVLISTPAAVSVPTPATATTPTAGSAGTSPATDSSRPARKKRKSVKLDDL